MSLFKVNRGNEANLPTKLTDGWAYFCTDTASFLIDHYDSTNTLVRSKINAEYTDKLRYVQNDEPIDVPDGTLWLDLDEEGSYDGSSSGSGSGSATSVNLDTTLTKSGYAADAKAVGDALAEKSQVQVITSESSEVLSTLKIHKLTQDEYNQELANGTLDENALYLTPDEAIDLSAYATEEYVNNAIAQKSNIQIITWEADD